MPNKNSHLLPPSKLMRRVIAATVFGVAIGLCLPLMAQKHTLTEAEKRIAAGAKFYQDKRFDRAIAEFEAALRHDANNPDALYNIGVCYTALGRIADAKKAYERLLKSHPKHADGLTNLGELFDTEGDTQKAEELYRQAISANPKFGRAYHNLGFLLEKRGDDEKAIEAYRQHLSVEEVKPLERREPYAYYSLGVVYLRRGEVKAAKELFLKAYSIEPDSVFINNALGNVFVLEKNAALALGHFTAAQKADSKYPPIYEGFGDVYRLQGNEAKALEAYKRAIALRPDYASVHYKLGELTMKTSPQEAIDYFQNYLKYGKSPAEKERVEKIIAELKTRLK